MIEKIKNYYIEILVGIVIFGIIIYFLPVGTLSIPDISNLQLSGVSLNFVMDDDVDIMTGQIQEMQGDDIGTGDTIEDIDNQYQEEITSTGVIVRTGSLADLIGDSDISISDSTQTKQSYNNCTAPWGSQVKHGEWVFAYQQRSDDPGICNVQRRTCNDGILNGSYTQASCREYMAVNPRSQEIVSYNVPGVDPYIQPTPIDKTLTNQTTITFPSSSSNTTTTHGGNNTNTITGTSTIGSTPISVSCTTPRGESVGNGQFAKAYRLNNGFSNLPCEVELRYCVQGNLQGSFNFARCIHNDIAIEDFLNEYYDPKIPSLLQLINTLSDTVYLPERRSSNNSYVDMELLISILEGLR